jgi:hypothetical protein
MLRSVSFRCSLETPTEELELHGYSPTKQRLIGSVIGKDISTSFCKEPYIFLGCTHIGQANSSVLHNLKSRLSSDIRAESGTNTTTRTFQKCFKVMEVTAPEPVFL